MKKRTKIAILILAVPVALLIVLGVALTVAFPAERVGRLAAERASSVLDRDVTVDRVRLKLWPAPAVAMEGVTVARWRNSQPEDSTTADSNSRPLAQVNRVEVRPRLLPLLRKELVVDEIVIDQPVLRVEVDGAADPVPESVREGSTGFWDDATLQIDRILVRDGRLEYRDVTTGGVAVLDDIDQEVRLSGEMRDGELARLGLAGTLSAATVDVDMPDALATPIHDIPLRIEHDAVVDLSTSTATLHHVTVALEDLVLEGSGTIEAWSDPARRRINLGLETPATDVAALIRLLPETARSWPKGAVAGEAWSAVAGRAGVIAQIDGRFGDGEVPALDGTLTLDDVDLARGGDPIIAGLTGDVKFSLESAATDGLTGQLLGEPLRLAFDVQDLAKPVVSGTVEARLDLARAVALGLLPEGWEGTGSSSIDLAVNGPIMQPADVDVDGTVSLAGIRISGPTLPAPVAVSSGGLNFSGAEMVGRGLNLTMGGSDAAVDFAATNWLPYALADSASAMGFAFDSRSALVDADELFPVDPSEPTYAELFFARLANVPVNGLSASDAAEAAGLALPEIPRIVLDGRIHADRLVQRAATYEDLNVEIAGREGQLELRSADFRMLGGGIQLSARLLSGPDSTDLAPLDLEFSVDDVGSDAFLQRFTAFRDQVSGSLALDGSLAMALDEHLLPDPATVTGTGNISVLNGQLANWPMVQALGNQLGIAQFDTIAFQNWNGRFDIVGSRVVLQETTIGGGNLRFSAAGSFDVGGRLDVAGTVYLPPALTDRVTGQFASTLATTIGGDTGEVPVGVRISGTTRQPSVALDLSEAGRRLADRAREEAEARARDLAAQAADRLVGSERIPSLDSSAADSVRGRVGTAVVDRLRGLIGGRRQPAATDSIPADTAADSGTVP